jgi:predicted peroxiredoxin
MARKILGRWCAFVKTVFVEPRSSKPYADKNTSHVRRNALKFCPFPKTTHPAGDHRGTTSISHPHGAIGCATVPHCCWILAGASWPQTAQDSDEKRWGSDDPTKAAFPFSHGLALAEAGHEVQIYLLGEAVVLMRKVVADAVTPVGWPAVGDFLNKLTAKHVQIYACGACSKARGVTESDLANYGAKFGNPAIFVSLIEWADHIITE